MTKTNYWLTSDIKIHTDSMGCMTAEHSYAGTLIDADFYESRTDCRREAVKILKEKKEEG